MSERGERWGVLPNYWSYQGHQVGTSPETEDAILNAMGATGEHPSRGRRFKIAAGPCVTGPDRAWGWAVQLYALRSKDSWGIGDMADLRRFARWSRGQGASLILLNPLGAQTPTLPYQASPYYASSRRFRNTMYIRIEEIDGAEQVAAELEPLRQSRAGTERPAAHRLRRGLPPEVQALEAIFQAVPEPRGLPHGPAAKAAPCATSPPTTLLPRRMAPHGAIGRQSSGIRMARASTGERSKARRARRFPRVAAVPPRPPDGSRRA